MSSPPANLEPTGSRKRKAPIDDNGEPVVLAKKKIVRPRVTKKQKYEMATAPMATAPQKPVAAKKSSASSSAKPQVSRQASVENIFDERDHPCSLPPRNSQYILESEDEEENGDPVSLAMDIDDKEEEKDPEEEEEDAEAELGLFSLLLCHKQS